MSDPTFAQPERRSFFVPVVIAMAALAIAIALAIHFFPATTVNIDHVHTDVLLTSTTFKGSSVGSDNGTRIVGFTEKHETLFVASTIKVDNQLRAPLYLDDFHITVTDQNDAEITMEAVRKADLPAMQINFPGIRPMLATPLERNTVIDPGKSAQGTVLFALSIPKDIWDNRKSAVIKADIYHQPSVYVTIPK